MSRGDSQLELHAAVRQAHGDKASDYVDAQEAWLAKKTLSDGAILYTSTEIEPYYANVAATGETAVRSKLSRVRAWMQWYVTHLNRRDRWA